VSFDDVCASHAQTTVVQPAGRECGYPGGVMASFTRQRSVFRSWASSAVMTAEEGPQRSSQKASYVGCDAFQVQLTQLGEGTRQRKQRDHRVGAHAHLEGALARLRGPASDMHSWRIRPPTRALASFTFTQVPGLAAMMSAVSFSALRLNTPATGVRSRCEATTTSFLTSALAGLNLDAPTSRRLGRLGHRLFGHGGGGQGSLALWCHLS